MKVLLITLLASCATPTVFDYTSLDKEPLRITSDKFQQTKFVHSKKIDRLNSESSSLVEIQPYVGVNKKGQKYYRMLVTSNRERSVFINRVIIECGGKVINIKEPRPGLWENRFHTWGEIVDLPIKEDILRGISECEESISVRVSGRSYSNDGTYSDVGKKELTVSNYMQQGISDLISYKP